MSLAFYELAEAVLGHILPPAAYKIFLVLNFGSIGSFESSVWEYGYQYHAWIVAHSPSSSLQL